MQKKGHTSLARLPIPFPVSVILLHSRRRPSTLPISSNTTNYVKRLHVFKSRSDYYLRA